MVMHPTVPSLDGKILHDAKFNNANGRRKNLFQAFVEVTRDHEEGFVDYSWPKPTKNRLTARTEKVSLVRLHGPTGWIIGSGAYIDNIEEVVSSRKIAIEDQVYSVVKRGLAASGGFLILALMLTYGLANSIAKPIIRLATIADEIRHGRNLRIDVDERVRRGEIGDLAKSIDRLKSSVRIIVERTKQQRPG